MERAWAMVVRRLAAIHLRRHAHLCRLSAVASSCGEKVGNLQRGGRGRRAFFIDTRFNVVKFARGRSSARRALQF